MTATASANVFGGSRAGSALLRAWGAPFALAEAFNRRTTFIAAFQIAQGMTESQLRDTGGPLRSSSPRTWSTRRRGSITAATG